MNSDMDRRKTLTELEGKDWGPPNFDSHLVTTIHQLRHKPLEQFTVEDLRINIGQNIALEWLLPMAIERLQDDPLVEGDYYRGDLLNAVLTIEPYFWSDHRELRGIVAQIAQQATTCRQELDEIEVEALDGAISAFKLIEGNDSSSLRKNGSAELVPIVTRPTAASRAGFRFL